ncbi:ABC transporter ATP-binding protein, partial [Leucobacter albus]|uniref:ABC transporter ATP-binding protein n=1 Tax=Leucobacter albus TaxID=272210 RepID=UPI003630B106
ASGGSGASNRRATTGPLVEARGVVRRYGDFSALSGVSLSVRPGEIVGLLGGNGAGKTTLMRILLGLETATSGETGLLGRHPSLQSRRSIGYVAQGLGLYPSLSARANLEFTAAAHRVAPPLAALRFAAAQGSGPTSALPLGTQRQLAYLAATVHDPALVVLDEPTSGMDALARAELWRDLRAAAELGVGTLITTHYMQEAAQCDRLIILTAGRVTSEGPAAAIVAGRSSLVVETPRVNAAFAALTAAGIAAVLSGTAIRVPGANRAAVAAALADLGGAVSIEAQPTTLEEAMLLDALTANRAG